MKAMKLKTTVKKKRTPFVTWGLEFFYRLKIRKEFITNFVNMYPVIELASVITGVLIQMIGLYYIPASILNLDIKEFTFDMFLFILGWYLWDTSAYVEDR